MNGDRLMKLVPPYEYRHARLYARMRVGVGVWLLILTAILYGYDRGGWWRVLLIPTAALLFYTSYRLPRAVMQGRIRPTRSDGRTDERRAFLPGRSSRAVGRVTSAKNESPIALPCTITGSSRAASGTLASVPPGGADRV